MNTQITHAGAAGHMSHPTYRADIDGLRGVAVLSVIAFHAFPALVSGGFFGVDIFFVISGYLISTIIFNNLQNNSFSFSEFYIRRIRRIFPALALVLAASICAGWLLLLPDEFKQLGKHISGGAAFISNYQFWSESGYFDNASETKPMLHLWSLGIEEQFYIVWPLLLWMMWRRKYFLLALMSAATVLSFILNVDLVIHHAKAAFFSPPTRFWELSMGALLAYAILQAPAWRAASASYSSQLRSRLLHILLPAGNGNLHAFTGSALVAGSVLLLTREHQLPGWWALLPTLGAVWLIAAGAPAWPNRALLANRLMVWFGKISFPLYLWHWPLLSFAHIVHLQELEATGKISILILAVFLAWLTYRLIEKPLRFGAHARAKSLGLILLMVIIGIGGLLIHHYNGLSCRLPGDRAAYADYFENSKPDEKYFARTSRGKNYRDDCNFYQIEQSRLGKTTLLPRPAIDRSCYTRDAGIAKSVFIWGDSHAQQLYIGLRHKLPADWQILQVASSGCAPGLNAAGPSAVDYCQQSNWFALDAIHKARPDVVIVGQAFSHNIKTMQQIAARLQELGIAKIVFTGPTPHWTADLPRIILRRLWIDTPRRTYNGIEQRTLEENRALQENFSPSASVSFANITNVFCNPDGCLTYLGDDKMTGITSWDYGHLTEIASDYLAQELLVKMVTGCGDTAN